MRIAAITTSFLPRIGGAEFAVHHLASHWARQGHDVAVFNHVTDKAEPDAEYRVERYRASRGMWRFGPHRYPFSRYAGHQIQRLIDGFRPDFVSAHFAYPVAIWLQHVRSMPPYLVTSHGPALNVTPTGPRQRYGIDGVLKEAFNRSSGAVAISSHARQILEQIGVDSRKIIDIPNGVDVQRFRTRVTDFDLRAEFDLPEDAIVLLSVGRCAKAKAYDDAMRSFALSAKESSRLFYVVLGKGVSTMQAPARELGIDERVRLCEGLYDQRLVAAYQQADIFFLPSRKELCPLVVPEAMAAGLPAVVTNVSGSQDMVVQNLTGFIVEPGDIDAIADRVTRLALDADLRSNMGSAGSRRAELYDWDTLSRRYLDHAG